MTFFIINGPNLNLLGLREPDIYGTTTYQQLVQLIEQKAKEMDVAVEIFQSNHEGAIVDEIQRAFSCADAIIINPAAYTHTSIAILDALKAVALPAAEVHLSDIAKREDFRKISYAGQACQFHFIGQGVQGYLSAMQVLYDVCLAPKQARNE